MKLLSIVITCFNEEKYVRYCLESIINQNEFQRGKVEIIVINDGSTDNSKDIISSFVQENSNIRIINTANNGLSMARNIGIIHSIGEYIMFVDSDDWLLKGCIKDIIHLGSKYSPDVIIGLVEGVPMKGVKKNYSDPDISHFQINEDDSNFLIDLSFSGIKMTPAWKYIFKRSVVIKNNLLFNNLLHEDYLWSPLLLCYSDTYKLFPTYFYKYRLRNDGLSSNQSLSAANDCLIICKKLYSKANIFSKEKKQFLYLRCEYLLRKINEYTQQYTSEEKAIMELLMNEYNNVISHIENNKLSRKRKHYD